MPIDQQFAWRALITHFGAERVNSVSSSRRRFPSHLLPDLQAAILSEVAPFDASLSGLNQSHAFQALTMSSLLVREGLAAVAITPLQYQDMDIGEEQPFAALSNGLWLFHVDDAPAAILLSHYEDHFGRDKVAQVETAYLPTEEASRWVRKFIGHIEVAGGKSSLYRGKVLSFEAGSDYSGMRADMLVHKLPKVDRNEVILSDGTMLRLDQHVFEFDRHRTALKRLGQSTRKGILLYGPPGTGKTHIIRYISSKLSDHTTVLITAEQVGNLTRYMTLARTLQPSIVVLEDVDLVGRSRDAMNSPNTEVLLNRLLNEMDGLRTDADVLFILTTNRPEDIEDALASRPGRVDEAIEVSLPDALCRERLILLYGQTLQFQEGAIQDAVSRSEGASAAFMKEMVRRLAQRGLSRDASNRIVREDVDIVFDDALDHTNRMGRRLIGMSEARRSRTSGEGCC